MAASVRADRRTALIAPAARLQATRDLPVSGNAGRPPALQFCVMLRGVIVDDSPQFLEAARGLVEREGTSTPGGY